jgi:hypothetical protein
LAGGLLMLVALTTTVLFLRERGQIHAAVARAEEAEWQQYVSDMHSAMLTVNFNRSSWHCRHR